ncbi:MAG: Uma2 family endonuclease [Actinomycetota bacterium]|nr:Uma2 family endonuclease [Actinomycetota bacterium]
MSSGIPERRGPWLFEELAGLSEDDRRYEVVDGVLVVTPPPGQLHQSVGAELFLQLARCTPSQWRVVYEWPLPLGTDGRVPDLAVVRDDAPLRGSGPYPAGPEHVGLVVEIVSPSSRKTDRFAKPGEYAEAAIPLFWRVETEPSVVVHAFALQDGAYIETAATSAGELSVPWGRVAVDLSRFAES